MLFQCTIQKCSRAEQAFEVSNVLAPVLGKPTEYLADILQKTNLRIHHIGDDIDVQLFKLRLESLGATVEIGAEPEGLTHDSRGNDEEEDEDEAGQGGRMLTDDELTATLGSRRDIFCADKNQQLSRVEMACLFVAMVAGGVMSRMEVANVLRDGPGPDFVSDRPHSPTVFMGKPVDRPLVAKPAPVAPRPTPTLPSKRELHARNQTPALDRGTSHGGGGDYHSRITKRGVLGLLAEKITGRSFENGDLFGKGGNTERIDAILSGMQGIARGGSGGAGRHGEAGIGFGAGYGSGFGGGSGMSDIEGLMSAPGMALNLTKRPDRIVDPRILVNMDSLHTIIGHPLTGGRNKSSIMRVIQQNIAALRYAYNRYLREYPALQGKVTIKFAINEYGKVIFCEVANSSTGNSEFDQAIVGKIKYWTFEKIDMIGDVTEVVYPFVFSM
jgi:TonB family protein